MMPASTPDDDVDSWTSGRQAAVPLRRRRLGRGRLRRFDERARARRGQRRDSARWSSVPDIDDDEAVRRGAAAARAPARRSRAHPQSRGRRGGRRAPASRTTTTSDDTTPGHDATSTSPPRIDHRRGPRRGRPPRVRHRARRHRASSSPLIVAVAAFELYEGFRRAGFHPATLIGLLGVASRSSASRTTTASRAFPLVIRGRGRASRCSGTSPRSCTPRPMVNTAVTMLGVLLRGRARRFRRAAARLSRRRRA